MRLTLYCNPVSNRHIHCNMAHRMKVRDPSLTIAQIIADTPWAVEDGDVYCPEHSSKT
jgi:hypothetical protein